MTYSIRIIGLQDVQRVLNIDLRPVIEAASLATAAEVQGIIAPYPPATIANSPGNPTRRWYERGYGPKWRTLAGEVHGRQTSQTLDRHWAIAARGMGAVLGNAATYAGRLHAQTQQVPWAAARGWITDKSAIERAIQSGAVARIFGQAIVARLRGNR